VDDFGCAVYFLHLVVHGALSKLSIVIEPRPDVQQLLVADVEANDEVESEEADVLSNLDAEVDGMVGDSPVISTRWQAMSIIREYVGSFRKIVNYFRKSSKGKDRLMFEQTKLGITPPLSVISDVATARLKWFGVLFSCVRL
jgi:hypothetical protein